MANLNLLVIRSPNPDRCVAFYSALGLHFEDEQHSNGPRHFASQNEGFVFEIYPSDEDQQHENVRLGFRVDSMEETLAEVRNIGARHLSEPKSSPWGLRAVVEDPDGRKIELTAASNS